MAMVGTMTNVIFYSKETGTEELKNLSKVTQRCDLNLDCPILEPISLTLKQGDFLVHHGSLASKDFLEICPHLLSSTHPTERDIGQQAQ